MKVIYNVHTKTFENNRYGFENLKDALEYALIQEIELKDEYDVLSIKYAKKRDQAASSIERIKAELKKVA